MSENIYRVNYAFEHLDSEERPESQRWGFGHMDIITDHEPTTDEDFKEIARTIGKEGNYKTVAIQSVATKPENQEGVVPFVDGEILE
jgi:hypothetical protein